MAWFLVALSLLQCSRAAACPYCPPPGKTIANFASECDLVLHVRLSQSRQALEGHIITQRTEMEVLRVLKPHRVLDRAKYVSSFIPAAEVGPFECILFGRARSGNIEAVHILAVSQPSTGEYVAARFRLIGARGRDRVAFAFKYLDSLDPIVAKDAHAIFANASWREVQAAARHFDRERLAAWLSGDVPPERVGLYGLLLGWCGQPEDAAVLRLRIDDESKPPVGIDGLLAGYTQLDRAAGTERTVKILLDSNADLSVRKQALGAIRFLVRSDPKVDRDTFIAVLEQAIDVDELTDLAIDELRRLKVWSALPKVVASYQPEDRTAIRQAVLRFALRCADQRARDFVAEVKKKDAQLVMDVENRLEYDPSLDELDEFTESES